MKRLSEADLQKAGDYEELKWYNGTPIVVAAFGETWKRIAAAEGYSPYFTVSDGDETEDFFSTYSDNEPIEPSN